MTDKNNSDAREKACGVCNNAAFTWGNLSIGKTEDQHRSKVFFREFGMTYEDGDMPIHVRRCLTCGNVLMFINDR